jgi:hypothetical protein
MHPENGLISIPTLVRRKLKAIERTIKARIPNCYTKNLEIALAAAVEDTLILKASLLIHRS